MSASDKCAVRRCRHTRAEHVPEIIHYTRQDGVPGSYEAHGKCTAAGCTCNGFRMVNGLQPTRPCARCKEEFLPSSKHRLCPECRRTASEETLDTFTLIARSLAHGVPLEDA